MSEVSDMQKRNFRNKGDRSRLAELEDTISSKLQGVYMNFLCKDFGYEQLFDDVVDILTSAYGGGVAAIGRFISRVLRQHMNPVYRAANPSAHYAVYDEPGYTANFVAAVVFETQMHEFEIWASEGILCNFHRLWTTDTLQHMLRGLAHPDWSFQSRLNRMDPLLTTARLKSSLDAERRAALQDQTQLDGWLVEQAAAPRHSSTSTQLGQRRERDDIALAAKHSHLPPISGIQARPLTSDVDVPPFEPEDDDLLVLLREEYNMSFKEIQRFLPGRLWEPIRGRYTNVLSPNAKLTRQNKAIKETAALAAQHDAVSGIVPRPLVGKNALYSTEDDVLLVYLRETAGLPYKQLSQYFPGRTYDSIVNRCTKRLVDSKVGPGPFVRTEKMSCMNPRPEAHSQLRFTPEDDRLIIYLFEDEALQSWQEYAELFPGRAKVSPRQRYDRSLRTGKERDLALATDLSIHFKSEERVETTQSTMFSSPQSNNSTASLSAQPSASATAQSLPTPVPTQTHVPPTKCTSPPTLSFSTVNGTPAGLAKSTFTPTVAMKQPTLSFAAAVNKMPARHETNLSAAMDLDIPEPTAPVESIDISARPRAAKKKSHFSPGDDKLILHLRDDLRWSYKDMVAKFPGRDLASLQNRYSGYLSKSSDSKVAERVKMCARVRIRPEMQKLERWLPEDDRLVIHLKEDIGTEFQQCAKFFPGRSATSIRKRYVLLKPSGHFRTTALQVELTTLLIPDSELATTIDDDDSGGDAPSQLVGSKRRRVDALNRSTQTSLDFHKA